MIRELRKNVGLYPKLLASISPNAGPTDWQIACAKEKYPIPVPKRSLGSESEASARQQVAEKACPAPCSSLKAKTALMEVEKPYPI